MASKYCQIDEAYKLMQELRNNVNPRSWEKTYSYRIIRFFEDYLSQEEHKNRKLMAITENEIDNFLESLPYKHNEKVNYYRALKLFFDFSAQKGVTQPFYIKVKKLTQVAVDIKYITDEHVKVIIEFINSTYKIEHRLMLALFLYTGLSRQYIANLTFSQINDDITCFRLNHVEYEIPIKEELSNLLHHYRLQCGKKRNERFFNINENTLSIEVKYITKNACGCAYSPTEYSNTFIKKALGEEDKWTNIFAVSQLTMESISTIAKHIDGIPTWLTDEQRKILRKWK